MRRIAGRLAISIPTLLLASMIVFALVQLIPGNPAVAIAGDSATKAQIAAISVQLGLNLPLPVQYWHWLTAVLHGNLGNSLITGEPVAHAISQTLPVTLSVVLAATVVSVVLGIPAGLIAGWWGSRAPDRLVSLGAAVGVAVPNFWLGLILASVLALQLRLLPATGYTTLAADPAGWAEHLIMPGLALGAVGAAELARQLRGAVADTLASDYVRTLRAKGLRTRRLVIHVIKNCSVPALSILGLQISAYLGGTVVVETVFGLPGMGAQILNATLQKDYVMIQGVVLLLAVFVVITNLIIDISYSLLDPRIR
jgi:peptide/nickel transport system permease protein